MRSLIIAAVVLSLASPVFASNNRQAQVQKQVSKQVNRQGFVARFFNRGNGHNNAQQFNAGHRQQQNFNGHHSQQFRAVQRQRVVFVPVERLESGHCGHTANNDNAGVLQLNSGCSALYR